MFQMHHLCCHVYRRSQARPTLPLQSVKLLYTSVEVNSVTNDIVTSTREGFFIPSGRFLEIEYALATVESS